MDDQARAARFIEEHDLGGETTTWVHDLQSELGEVAKEVLTATDYGDTEPSFDDAFAEEVGDLYFSLLGLAHARDIDLSAALQRSLEKYERRVDATGDAGSGE